GRELNRVVMTSFVFRRAQPPDYPAILRLQSANFIANLSEEERKEGFLSAEFSPEQVSRLAEDPRHDARYFQWRSTGVSVRVPQRIRSRVSRHREDARYLRSGDVRGSTA